MKVSLYTRQLTNYERYLVSALAQGATVGELPVILKFCAVDANSMSSIEKTLRALRKELGCRTNTQLIYKLRHRIRKLDIDQILKS